ncbi:unnamed protein product [Jaminaea pallidilutea]
MPPPTPPFKTFETVNFYTGSSLNRLSWLRTDSNFLNKTLVSPRTRFLLLQNLNPLASKGGDRDGYLATVGWNDVKQAVLQTAQASGHDGSSTSLFGPEANGVGQASDHQDLFEKSTAGIGPTGLALVFLGIDEEGQQETSLPGQLAQGGGDAAGDDNGVPAGTPYFALSLTYRPKGDAASASQGEQEHPLSKLEKQVLSNGNHHFVDTRSLSKAGEWPMKDAALVAQARALVDWNERNHFCPACSRRQYSVWAGYKRACASTLIRQLRVAPCYFTKSLAPAHHQLHPAEAAAGDDGLGDCPSTTTLSNFSYPRTDPVVIMGVLSPDGERLLLGRQKKWPKGFWSCLAGFIEPGESLEEAVRREVLEESGVRVEKVVYHSSQSWPFPNQLMEGCYGICGVGPESDGSTADSSSLPEVNLALDNELEAAKWFTREEILSVIDKSAAAHMTKADVQKIDDAREKAGGHQGEKDQARGQEEHKDPGSIANTDDGGRGDGGTKLASLPDDFKIPPATAIAHVLIAAWARGEAILPLPAKQTQGQHQQYQQQQAKV